MSMQPVPSAGAHPASRFVKLNNLRLHYIDWGGDSGRSLLLLHGGAANTHWWDQVAPELTAAGRVLALDFRGHGRSQWAVPPHYGPATYLEDVKSFIEFIGGRVVLIGHSMGGAIAQWTAAHYPNLIEALVVVDAPPGPPPLWMRLQWRWRRRSRGGPRPELAAAEEIVRRFRFSPPETFMSKEAIAELALKCAEQLPNGRWAYRFDPETRSWRRRHENNLPRPRLKSIAAPTLILRGAQSTLISRRRARAMRRGIPGARLVEIERAYHHVPLDNPARTAAAILEFLSSLEA